MEIVTVAFYLILLLLSVCSGAYFIHRIDKHCEKSDAGRFPRFLSLHAKGAWIIFVCITFGILFASSLFMMNTKSEAAADKRESEFLEKFDATYDHGYSVGYNKGYSKGYDSGEEDGYENGLDAGYILGYEVAVSEYQKSIDSGTADLQTTYIGNSSSKVFHLPTCLYLPHPQNQVELLSREEAIVNGYIPCAHCNP